MGRFFQSLRLVKASKLERRCAHLEEVLPLILPFDEDVILLQLSTYLILLPIEDTELLSPHDHATRYGSG